MNRKPPSLILPSLVLALVVLAAAALASVRNARAMSASSDRVSHTYQVLNRLSDVLAHLSEAEAGQRGYMITGDPTYAAPYVEAIGRLAAVLNELAALTADNPNHTERLAELEALVERRLTLLEQGTHLRETQGFAAAQAHVRTNAGQEVSEDIRQLVQTMQAEELALLATRTEAARVTAINTLLFILVGTVSSLGILVAVFWLLQREIRQRARTEAALVEESALLRALMDTLPDTIYFKDTASRFTRINRSQAKVLGLSDPRQAIGKTDLDFKPAALAQSFLAEDREVLDSGKALIDRVEANPTADGQPRFFSTTKLPLLDEAGHVVGLVGVSRDITRRVAIEEALHQANERLTHSFAALERANARMVLLNEMLDLLATCESSAEAYQVIASSARRLLPAELGVLYLLNDSHNLLEAAVSWGSQPLAGEDELLQPNDCWSVRRGRLHRVAPGQSEAACRHAPAEDTSTYVCAPLSAQGETLGMLHLRNPAAAQDGPDGAPDAGVHLVKVLADHLSLALANLRLRETLRTQAIRDPLTGLFNRRYLEEALDRELVRADRRGTTFALAMMDLDHFKRFNDTFGHAAGDALLRAFGDYLRRSVRGEDIPCRYGGEEFVLVLADVTLDQARQRAHQLLQGIDALSVQHHGQSLGAVTISMGLAEFPTHGRLAAELIRAADAALYQAKAQGRNRLVAAAPQR